MINQKFAHHHNCNRSGDLFRPEDLAEMAAEAVAELLTPIISRKLMARSLSARRGAIGLLREPDFPSLKVL